MHVAGYEISRASTNIVHLKRRSLEATKALLSGFWHGRRTKRRFNACLVITSDLFQLAALLYGLRDA